MRVFLTGGTGFIGQRLVPALRRRGWEVTALVRRPDGGPARALVALGATPVAGDVTDRETMRVPMKGADLVIHAAAHYELGVTAGAARRMEAVNVGGTDHVLGLALEFGIARTVYVSSVQVWGDTGATTLRDESFVRESPTRTHYDRSKTAAHHVAREYQARGLPLVIVCPNGVVGPNDHSVWGYFVRLYLAGLMPPMAWCPESRFALVEVSDLAEGIALAAERGRSGQTYVLSGESKTLREHFAFWYQRPGGFRVRLWLPWWVMWVALWPLEPIERWLGLSAFLSRETVASARTSFHYSSAKAERELGWSHRSAQAMWSEAFDGEFELLKRRTSRNLVSRLNPIETAE
jgi:dihydroflavonol-4-reductase